MNEADHANPHTVRRVAEFVSGVRHDDILFGVLSRLKLMMLDSLSRALYAPKLPSSQILISQLAALDDCLRHTPH